VFFENGQSGEVLSLHQNSVEVLLFSQEPLLIGTKAARTGEELTIPVGGELLGCVIDALGRPISCLKPPKTPKTRRTLTSDSLGIETRASVRKPLETGVALVDMLVPLGRGQRELIIGDRKTGKTSFLLQTLYNQAKNGTICIYGAIGRKQAEIKTVQNYFIKLGVMDKMIIIAAGAEDPAGLIYLTPYSACAIAEYFRDQGIDTVIVLDDMTTHAKFYREICLLAKRFPGRDSYPVDIFYAHARMLEKGGNFKLDVPGGVSSESSITILPVIQTAGGDLSGYIQTNMMSMTDGHIYFDSDLFASGKRPAVNPFLSVTRVGRQAQSSLKREINREILAFLTNYEKLQSFVHFGAELTEDVRLSLAKGERIYSFFEQNEAESVPSNLAVYVLSLIWLDYFQIENTDQLRQEYQKIFERYTKEPVYRKKIDSLVDESQKFSELLDKIKNTK